MHLRITEIDQTIVPTCDADKYVPPNDFIRDLVAAAREHGSATHEDADGCAVTATVWDD